jgi:lincosamide nucleotidyltransferase A/C/D/E
MVSPEDAINLYQSLLSNGIPCWLNGGWGIDALLGEQTRPHKDLDVFVLVDDINRLYELLSHTGFTVKEVWSENRWVVNAQGGKTMTGFVLQDPEGRELDVHALRIDQQGNGIPAWEAEDGLILAQQDLAGVGSIDGFSVQCISAEMQLLFHTGYTLPEYQIRDLKRLHDKFGL